jgi:hypothetical protein
MQMRPFSIRKCVDSYTESEKQQRNAVRWNFPLRTKRRMLISGKSIYL